MHDCFGRVPGARWRHLSATESFAGRSMRGAGAAAITCAIAGSLTFADGLYGQASRTRVADSAQLRWTGPDVPLRSPSMGSPWHYEELSLIQLAGGPAYLARSGTAELGLRDCMTPSGCAASIRATSDSLGSGATPELARYQLIGMPVDEGDLLASFVPLTLPSTAVAVGESWRVSTGYEVETKIGAGSFEFNGMALLDSIVGASNRLVYISVKGTSRTSLTGIDGVLQNAEIDGTYVWNVTEGRLERAYVEELAVAESTNRGAPLVIRRTRLLSRPTGELSSDPPPGR